MDLSNNKIAPIEIETLETLSSEIENQNVPSSTFSKTDHSSVRQINDATDNELDSIHYFTWLFGILLTCTSLLSTLIVPWHNVLKEPMYMYEFYVYSAPTWLVFVVTIYIMRLEYWAGIKYDKKINLFFFLIGIFGVIYAVIAVLHLYIHVYYFELFAPPPYAGLVPGNVAAFCLVPILFFRYYHT